MTIKLVPSCLSDLITWQHVYSWHAVPLSVHVIHQSNCNDSHGPPVPLPFVSISTNSSVYISSYFHIISSRTWLFPTSASPQSTTVIHEPCPAVASSSLSVSDSRSKAIGFKTEHRGQWALQWFSRMHTYTVHHISKQKRWWPVRISNDLNKQTTPNHIQTHTP